MNVLDTSTRGTLSEFKDLFLRLHKQQVFSNYPHGLFYNLSAPLHLGIEHSAAQNQCYAVPNDDRHQPMQNSIDQPEGDANVKKQTECNAYLMGALELEKSPYLWDHSHCRQKSADKSDQFLPVQFFSSVFYQNNAAYYYLFILLRYGIFQPVILTHARIIIPWTNRISDTSDLIVLQKLNAAFY